MATNKISVSFDDATLAALHRGARGEHRSISNYLSALVLRAEGERLSPRVEVYADPLADSNGNRHHKDGSRCTDAYCRRAHAIPVAARGAK